MISAAESVHKVQRWSENYAVTLPHAQNVWISKSYTQYSKPEMLPFESSGQTCIGTFREKGC